MEPNPPAGRRAGRPKLSKDTERTCPTCSTTFALPEWNPKIYCSWGCAAAARRGKSRGTATQIEKICPVCGKTFLVYPSHVNTTCSRECMGKHRRTITPDAREMSEAEAAWLAGLFDGEGSIVITQRGRDNDRSISYRIVIYNTCRPLLEHVAKVTGIDHIKDRPSKNPRHADAYYWTCGGSNGVYLLRQMRPWLIVKADRADAVFEGRIFERQTRWDDIYPGGVQQGTTTT